MPGLAAPAGHLDAPNAMDHLLPALPLAAATHCAELIDSPR